MQVTSVKPSRCAGHPAGPFLRSRAFVEGHHHPAKQVQRPPLFCDGEGIWSWPFVQGQGQGQDPTSVNLTPEPARQTTRKLRAQSPLQMGRGETWMLGGLCSQLDE